jgi:hypothetical protein
MNARNGFVRRHSDDSAVDSICLHCFLTVSAVQGGANLSEMEMRHKCDPMTTIPPQKNHEVVVFINEAFGDYLFEDPSFEDFPSAPDTTEADLEKILQRLRKYCQRQGLSIMKKRTGNGSLG